MTDTYRLLDDIGVASPFDSDGKVKLADSIPCPSCGIMMHVDNGRAVHPVPMCADWARRMAMARREAEK